MHKDIAKLKNIIFDLNILKTLPKALQNEIDNLVVKQNNTL